MKQQNTKNHLPLTALLAAALLMTAAAPRPPETILETEMREFEERILPPPETETAHSPESAEEPETAATADTKQTPPDRARTGEYHTTPCGWYCRHMKNGAQPPIPPEFLFVTKYDGYYIDTRHTEPDAEERVIYLTFDAGYENGNIEKVLNVLKEEKVPGAFFILENLARQNASLVKRMAEEGHLVCNHTASHKDMTHVLDRKAFAAELSKMEAVCRECTGVTMAKYYRPPEGKFNEKNMADAQALGYKTVFWSFAYADWDNGHQMSEEKAIQKIMNGTHNGEVILLHPTSATNAAILQRVIQQWKKAGYRFGTLDELCAGG